MEDVKWQKGGMTLRLWEFEIMGKGKKYSAKRFSLSHNT